MNTQKDGRTKILCVDDDAGVLDAVARLLNSDYEVLKASSAEEAMTLLEANLNIAVVIADYKLPGKTGVELLNQVQERVPDTVRVLLSGAINVAELAEVVNAGHVHRVLLKPWDNEYFKIQVLESVALHATLRERRHLEKMSIMDSLTMLKNRRYLQDRLKSEVHRALRHERRVSLLMADLDHFKDYNDTYGHLAGDQLLREVAKRLQSLLRTDDTVARFGGEEFAMVLPDTPYESAIDVGERVRLSFVQDPVRDAQGREVQVTLSIGVAEVPKHATTVLDLIAAADQALYRAKGQGRNQTVGA